MRIFVIVLTTLGVDWTIWSSMSIHAISSDGKALAGDGYRYDGYTSWIARL